MANTVTDLSVKILSARQLSSHLAFYGCEASAGREVVQAIFQRASWAGTAARFDALLSALRPGCVLSCSGVLRCDSCGRESVEVSTAVLVALDCEGLPRGVAHTLVTHLLHVTQRGLHGQEQGAEAPIPDSELAGALSCSLSALTAIRAVQPAVHPSSGTTAHHPVPVDGTDGQAGSKTDTGARPDPRPFKRAVARLVAALPGGRASLRDRKARPHAIGKWELARLQACEEHTQLWEVEHLAQAQPLTQAQAAADGEVENEENLSSLLARLDDGCDDTSLCGHGPDDLCGHGNMVGSTRIYTRGEYLALKKWPQTKAILRVMRERLGGLLDQPGCVILDVGGGRGDLALLVAASFPTARVAVVDVNETSLEAGRARAASAGLANVTFMIGDVSSGVLPDVVYATVGAPALLLGLHTCGGLTDTLLSLSWQGRARPCPFIVVPCCFLKNGHMPAAGLWSPPPPARSGLQQAGAADGNALLGDRAGAAPTAADDGTGRVPVQAASDGASAGAGDSAVDAQGQGQHQDQGLADGIRDVLLRLAESPERPVSLRAMRVVNSLRLAAVREQWDATLDKARRPPEAASGSADGSGAATLASPAAQGHELRMLAFDETASLKNLVLVGIPAGTGTRAR